MGFFKTFDYLEEKHISVPNLLYVHAEKYLRNLNFAQADFSSREYCV